MTQQVLTVRPGQMIRVEGPQSATQTVSTPLVVPTPPSDKPIKLAKGNSNPMFTVEYTGKTSGKTRTYGVFWNGITTYNGETQHRLGLRNLSKTGTMFGRPFFVAADAVTRIS